MAIVDRHGLPVAVHVASPSPYATHLVPATLDARFLADLPPRLIGASRVRDQAYSRMERRNSSPRTLTYVSKVFTLAMAARFSRALMRRTASRTRARSSCGTG